MEHTEGNLAENSQRKGEIIEKLEDIQEKLSQTKTPWTKFISFTEKILIPGALAALAIVTHFTSKQLTEAQIKLTSLQQESERQRDLQLMKNDQKELDIMYLNLFYKELSKSTNTENTLKLLELLNKDLKIKLAEWIQSDKNYNLETRNKAQEIIKNSDQLENFKIGIYYKINDDKATQKANTIKSKLLEYHIGNTVQTYAKSDDFFKRVNPPKSNEVRYEVAYENSASLQLQESLNSLFPTDKFVRKTVNNRTTNFISIFIK